MADRTDLLRELLPYRTDLFRELLPDRADLFGQTHRGPLPGRAAARQSPPTAH